MEIIFLALVTAFVLFRLFKVLGTMEEDEKNPSVDEFEEIMKEMHEDHEATNAIEIADAFEAQLAPQLRETFDEFRKIDNNFMAQPLFEKAKKAFEIIVIALNSHDLKTLKPLLSEKVYKAFSEEVKRRKKSGEKITIQILAHKGSEIQAAKLIKNTVAQVKFCFRTDQLIQSSARNSETIEIEDAWTFEKDLGNTNETIWKLIAT